MGITKYVEVGVAFPSRGGAAGFVEGEIMTEGNTDARTTALAWLVRALSFAAPLGLSPASPVAAATPLQLTYRVTHAVFGDIGTYTNTVESTGDGATVLTRAHFEVSMLGVRMYREDAESTERWQGNRLVLFHGVSDKGDGRAEVKGEARGDNFVITLASWHGHCPGIRSTGQPVVGQLSWLQYDNASRYRQGRAGARQRRRANDGEDRRRQHFRTKIFRRRKAPLQHLARRAGRPDDVRDR